MERLSAMRILVVEDNPDDAEAVERLARRGKGTFEVQIASSGAAALELLASAVDLPELILLDLSLPGISGLEVLARLKTTAAWCDIPVIVLSGSERDEDVVVACERGAHSHFLKPMSQRDFDWIRSSLLHYRRTVRALAGLENLVEVE